MIRFIIIFQIYEVRINSKLNIKEFKYPTHQINFCTEKALKCLEYRGFEEVV